MKSVFVTIFLLCVANTLSADIFDELDREVTIIGEKEHKCTFPNSFLIGTCEGEKYYYVEKQSSVKRKDLSKFYRFVKKQDESAIISDICSDISSKNSTNNTIKCNDFGIVLELGDI